MEREAAVERHAEAASEGTVRIASGQPVPRVSGPTLVTKPVVIARPSTSTTLSRPASPASGVNATAAKRSDAGGEQREKVRRIFEEHGLWIRSIQMKNAQCITAPIVSPKEDNSVHGMFCDSWTYAHPSISQDFFQMGGDNGRRAVALMVDWTKTKDRYVQHFLEDASSNKTFVNEFAKPDKCEGAMRSLRDELGGRAVMHNEVRAAQIRREALIGLLWSPVRGSVLVTAEGEETWEQTKPKFQKFVNEIQKAGAAQGGLPIFVYERSATGMRLDFLDFIA